jgi:hypothetical protein
MSLLHDENAASEAARPAKMYNVFFMISLDLESDVQTECVSSSELLALDAAIHHGAELDIPWEKFILDRP